MEARYQLRQSPSSAAWAEHGAAPRPRDTTDRADPGGPRNGPAIARAGRRCTPRCASSRRRCRSHPIQPQLCRPPNARQVSSGIPTSRQVPTRPATPWVTTTTVEPAGAASADLGQHLSDPLGDLTDRLARCRPANVLARAEPMRRSGSTCTTSSAVSPSHVPTWISRSRGSVRPPPRSKPRALPRSVRPGQVAGHDPSGSIAASTTAARSACAARGRPTARQPDPGTARSRSTAYVRGARR